MDKINIIKQELQRRYSMLSNTSFKGLLVFAKNYFSFVEETNILKNILKNDEKNFKKNIEKDKFKEYDFMFWPIFRDIPTLIERELKKNINLQSETPFNKFLNNIGLKNKKLPKKYRQLQSIIKLFHDQLLRKVAEIELGTSEITPYNELVKKLGLNDQSKWEDIEIMFTNDSDVCIKYKDRLYKTSFDKLGFSDERKTDLTCYKGSWKFLLLLSNLNGSCPINKKDKEKQKKYKQEITKLLKHNFQILDNPFYPIDKDNREFRIKLKLTPESTFRPDWNDRDIYDDN